VIPDGGAAISRDGADRSLETYLWQATRYLLDACPVASIGGGPPAQSTPSGTDQTCEIIQGMLRLLLLAFRLRGGAFLDKFFHRFRCLSRFGHDRPRLRGLGASVLQGRKDCIAFGLDTLIACRENVQKIAAILESCIIPALRLKAPFNGFEPFSGRSLLGETHAESRSCLVNSTASHR